MRVHVVALPHTLLTEDYSYCAYTAKVRRFVSMLAAAGHEAHVYGPDIHDVPAAASYTVIVRVDDRVRWFGSPEWDRGRVFDVWDPAADCWGVTNARAAVAVRDRWRDGDVLGVIAGVCQQGIVDKLADLAPTVVEWGVGYSGVLPGSHKVFESYAWAHHVAGRVGDDTVRFFDRVIPNCYDPAEFTPSTMIGDYVLFMGRPTPRKGLPIVAELAARSGVPVVVAGQPGHDIPGATYAGLVTGRVKAELLAGALAVLTPTTYLEPFGGVAVEAMMSGTPVISSDWGAFVETVVPGVSGYRCRTLRDFLAAVHDVKGIDRAALTAWATDRYSTATGSRLYDAYLRDVDTLRGDGWYAL